MNLLTSRVAVVTVAWNCCSYIQRLLASLQSSTIHPQEVIVVDNASSDGTLEMIATDFPNVKVIALPENIGGSGGFARGVSELVIDDYDFIWLLDGDAFPAAEALHELVKEAVRVNAGIIGSKMVWASDRTTVEEVGGAVQWPSGIHAHFHRLKHIDDPIQPMAVDYVTACSMLCSKKLVQQIGAFHKDFFVFYDDIEYCFRARALGFSVVTAPMSIVFHEYTNKSQTAWRSYYDVRNKLNFLYDYGPPWKRFRILWQTIVREQAHADKIGRRGYIDLRSVYFRAISDFSRGILGKSAIPSIQVDSFVNQRTETASLLEFSGKNIIALMSDQAMRNAEQLTDALSGNPPQFHFIVHASSPLLLNKPVRSNISFIPQMDNDRYERRLSGRLIRQGNNYDFALLSHEIESDIHKIAPKLIFPHKDGFVIIPYSSLVQLGQWKRLCNKMKYSATATIILITVLLFRRKRNAKIYAEISKRHLKNFQQSTVV